MSSFRTEEEETLTHHEEDVYVAPATYQQRGMWFLSRLAPDNPVYNVPAALRLTGQLDTAAFAGAVEEIKRRHEALQTYFADQDGELLQVIDPALTAPLTVHDLSGLPEDQRVGEALVRARQEAALPFDLQKGPLWRAMLLRITEQDHLFVYNFHHAIADGWSQSVFVQELFELYTAFVTGGEASLPELELQYGDYAAWQQELIEGGYADEQLAYWQEQLTAPLPVLQLPSDRPRPPLQAFRGGHYRFAISAELTEQVRGLSQKSGTTLFMTLLTAYKAFLHRWTGQEDLIVGTPSAGRNRDEFEEMIGYFINMLPLRTALHGELTFAELLARVKETAQGAYARQDYPFERLVDELKTERSMSHSPIFQTVFVLQNTPAYVQGDHGLQLAPLKLEDNGTAKFDLNLTVEEEEGGLSAFLEYNSDLFDRETIERMAGQYVTLLAGAAADPQQKLWSLPLLSEAERAFVLQAPEEMPDNRWAELCLHQIFEEQVKVRPDAAAVVYEEQQLTYRELNAQANRLARRLQEAGVGAESRVGLFMERSLHLIVGMLAILKAGGAYVPLDPAYPSDRLAFMAEDAELAAILTESRLLDGLPKQGAQVVCTDEDLTGYGEDDLDSPCRPEQLAYIIYTSGSTGQPKGVLLPHANVVRLFTATEHWFSFDERDVWTMFHSFAFDFSVWEIFGALLYGGKLVVVPYFVSRSPQAFYELLLEEQVTVLNQTPSNFRLLIHAESEVAATKQQALRTVIFGGEALELQTLKPWFDRHGDFQPQLVNMYGITETTVHVTCRPISRRDLDGAASSVIGVPIPDLQVYVLDAQGQPVPIGVPGEMYVGGKGLARGYLNRPELTEERFIADPFSGEPGAKLYRTGDLARRLADGDLEYLGRIDHQVKVRGFRIELGEIEAVLTKHDAVREAVVIAREDAPGDVQLVAYLVAEAGAQTDGLTRELRSFLGHSLPEHMIPHAFVELERLPLTANGKVDRKALPKPQGEHRESAASYRAPETEQERLLCTVFAEVLQVPQVGVADNFFEIGGDSIKSIRVLSALGQQGVRLTIQQLFTHPTVGELAALLQPEAEPVLAKAALVPFALLSAEEKSRMPEGIADAYPLTKLQAGMVFHTEYTPESSMYHNITLYELEAPFDEQAWQKAADEMAARHGVIRTSFDLDSFAEPLQLVHETASVPVLSFDLRHLSREEQETALARWLAAEQGHRFDWKRPPLMRITLHRLSDTTFRFALTEHHAIFDGWSVAVLTTELFEAYRAALHGEASKLQPAPGLAFAEYVAMEREALASQADQAFWQHRTGGYDLTRVARWPIEQKVPTEKRLTDVEIGTNTSQGLQRLAKAAGVPLKSVLLAAHLRVLSMLSGETDVVTGMALHGRPEAEDGERMLGLFLNTLPMTMQMQEGTWLDLIRAVFAAEQEMLEHRRYPMAQIQQDLGGTPLFETVFNYTHFHVFEGLAATGLNVLSMIEYTETNFPLLLEFSLGTQDGEVKLALQWDAAEFAPEQIARMAGYYERALAAMADNPDAPYRQVSLLTKGEQAQLTAWSREVDVTLPDSSIHRLFEKQAAATPDAAAVLFGTQVVTYRELNERANTIAHRLTALGVTPGQMVGLCMERSAEMIIATLAILKAGGAYVPFDVNYPKERLHYMFQDASVQVLVTQQHLQAQIPMLPAHVLTVDAHDGWLTEGEAPNLTHDGRLDDLAYVMYTSGSTGLPKGVPVPHRGVVRLVDGENRYVRFAPDEVFLQFAPTAFDASTFEIWGALLHGAKVAVFPPHQASLQELGAEIQRHGVTAIFLTTALFNQMVDEFPEGLRGVRQLLSGGEIISIPHVKKLLGLHPDCLFVHVYGPTESTTFTTYHKVPGVDAVGSIVPIGRPIANSQVYILDSAGQPVPTGVPGELLIGGDGLAQGYLNKPEMTDEKFVPDRFAGDEKARLYKTGDLTRFLPDGSIEFIGRVDAQVKIRGFRIEPGEIQEALLMQDAVREAFVFAKASAAGDKRLYAYVSPVPGMECEPEALRSALKERLPDYMIPSSFTIVDRLPLTANGKVDRRALPEPVEFGRRDGGSAEPRTELERLIADTWSDVLKVEGIGIEDDFFELGGHSLLATQVITRLRKKLNTDLPLRLFFEAPTVSALAAHILSAQGAAGTDTPPLVPVPRTGGLPLSYPQQQLWLLEQFDAGSPLYNLPTYIRLQGQLDVDKLTASVREIISRHEALRTVFVEGANGPEQVIQSQFTFEPEHFDISHLPSETVEAEAQKLAQQEARRPFDLAQGPLIRLRIIRLAERDHLAVLNLHHIIGDGWSIGVIIDELAALYEAALDGQASPLPELSVQYADYAAWQREWMQGRIRDEQLDYWKKKLGGTLPVLNMPTDKPRPETVTPAGALHIFEWSEETTQQVKAFTQQTGATLFMTLLAAYNVLFNRHTGQEDFAIGTPVAGRKLTEVEPLIGCFINTLVMRNDLGGNPTFRELVGRVKDTALEAYAHQDLPFEKLVEELAPDRSLSQTPLFQSWFVFLNTPEPVRELPGLTMKVYEEDYGTTKFDLSLSMGEKNGRLYGDLNYRTELYVPETIAGLVAELERILQIAAAEPGITVSDLTARLKSEAEQKRSEQEAQFTQSRSSRLKALKSKHKSKG